MPFILGALVVGIGALFVAAQGVIALLGFGTAGIAAGSAAASMMSASAGASGGVVAGSAVAVFQSTGATLALATLGTKITGLGVGLLAILGLW